MLPVCPPRRRYISRASPPTTPPAPHRAASSPGMQAAMATDPTSDTWGVWLSTRIAVAETALATIFAAPPDAVSAPPQHPAHQLNAANHPNGTPSAPSPANPSAPATPAPPKPPSLSTSGLPRAPSMPQLRRRRPLRPSDDDVLPPLRDDFYDEGSSSAVDTSFAHAWGAVRRAAAAAISGVEPDDELSSTSPSPAPAPVRASSPSSASSAPLSENDSPGAASQSPTAPIARADRPATTKSTDQAPPMAPLRPARSRSRPLSELQKPKDPPLSAGVALPQAQPSPRTTPKTPVLPKSPPPPKTEKPAVTPKSTPPPTTHTVLPPKSPSPPLPHVASAAKSPPPPPLREFKSGTLTPKSPPELPFQDAALGPKSPPLPPLSPRALAPPSPVVRPPSLPKSPPLLSSSPTVVSTARPLAPVKTKTEVSEEANSSVDAEGETVSRKSMEPPPPDAVRMNRRRASVGVAAAREILRQKQKASEQYSAAKREMSPSSSSIKSDREDEEAESTECASTTGKWRTFSRALFSPRQVVRASLSKSGIGRSSSTRRLPRAATLPGRAGLEVGRTTSSGGGAGGEDGGLLSDITPSSSRENGVGRAPPRLAPVRARELQARLAETFAQNGGSDVVARIKEVGDAGLKTMRDSAMLDGRMLTELAGCKRAVDDALRRLEGAMRGSGATRARTRRAVAAAAAAARGVARSDDVQTGDVGDVARLLAVFAARACADVLECVDGERPTSWERRVSKVAEIASAGVWQLRAVADEFIRASRRAKIEDDEDDDVGKKEEDEKKNTEMISNGERKWEKADEVLCLKEAATAQVVEGVALAIAALQVEAAEVAFDRHNNRSSSRWM